MKGVDEYRCDVVKNIVRREDGAGLVVELEKSADIKADAVVAATGFTIPIIKPGLGVSWTERKDEIGAFREAVRNAKNIVVAGSGASGIDMAGDIRLHADVQGGAKVHLITSGKYVLGGSVSERNRRELTKVIENAPGMVLHNDRVVGDDFRTPSITKRTIQLKSGKTIDADVYVPAFASWLAGKYLGNIDGATSPNGMVLQNHKTLQCTAEPAIFAVGCGDIITKEGCLFVPKTEAQIKTVAQNVVAFVSGEELRDHKEGAPFTDHEILVVFGHGYHTGIMSDNAGMPESAFSAVVFHFHASCVRACRAVYRA